MSSSVACFFALLFYGEAVDWWDVFGSRHQALADVGLTQDEAATYGMLIFLGLAFVAWMVEQIRDAIRSLSDGKEK